MTAKAFGNTKGKAASGADLYKYKDGENTVRLVGGVLPRYMYWLKSANDKQIPVECLSFDREKEKFTNKEVDHVQKAFPEVKCSWAYTMMCLDPTDGKVRPIALKKKLFEAIMSAADDLGDPTDPDTGWSIVFKRAKTGPLAFNIEYTLSVLRCKQSALTEEEKAVVAAADTIDKVYPRPTPDDVLELIRKIQGVETEESEEGAGSAAAESIKDL
jgi:hypothetical protein